MDHKSNHPHHSLIQKLLVYYHLHNTHCIVVLVWLIGIVVLVAALVRSFLPLLTDYTDNNMSTQVEVVKSDSRRPNVTVCLPYHSSALSSIAHWILDPQTTDCLECAELEARSWDVWNEMGLENFNKSQDLVVIENVVATAMMKKIFENASDLSYLAQNRSNFNWNQPIIDAVHKFLVCLYDMDFSSVTTDLWDWKQVCKGFDLQSLDLSHGPIDSLYEILIKALDVYVKIEVIYSGNWSSTPTVAALSDRHSVVFYENNICFPVLSNSTVEWFTYTAFPDQISPPWRRLKRTTLFRVWPDLASVYALTPYAEEIYQTDTFNIETISVESIDMIYEITFKVTDKRPRAQCVSDTTPSSVCAVQRQVRDTVEYCGCLPFSFRHLHPTAHVSYCNTSSYSMCTRDIRSQFPQYLQEFNNKCEYVFYKWKPSVYVETNEIPHQYFGVEFSKSAQSPYIEFSLVVKDTPEKFLSNIGGLVNLYLGFSGVSVCTFVIFLVEAIRHKLQGAAQKAAWSSQRTTSKAGGVFQHDVDAGLVEAIRQLIREELSQIRQDHNGMKEQVQRMELRLESLQEASGRRTLAVKKK